MEPGVSQAIKSLLADRDIHRAIRIELNFSGCCDSSLCLRTDAVLDGDLFFHSEGLVIVIDPTTSQLVGEVTIAYADKPGRKGFVITSGKPVGEWDGFSVTDIKI